MGVMLRLRFGGWRGCLNCGNSESMRIPQGQTSRLACLLLMLQSRVAHGKVQRLYSGMIARP